MRDINNLMKELCLFENSIEPANSRRKQMKAVNKNKPKKAPSSWGCIHLKVRKNNNCKKC